MIEAIDGKANLVIKRNGTLEPYDPNKLFKVLLWACNDNETLANSILDAIDLRIYNKIHISTLLDEVIDTTYNLISRLSPQYEEVAKRLYLQKMYKELHSMRRSEYPPYTQVLSTLVDAGIIINVFDHFTDEELTILGNAIDPSRDFNSTYLGLLTFFGKNSLSVNGKPVELLQHAFMRLAIQAFIYEPKNHRMQLIIDRYNHLSNGIITEATPKWLNSLTFNPQMASCCLHQLADTSTSINKVTADIGIYSKYGGGNAVDITPLRAKFSSISYAGKSSGPVPFLKKIEASVNAFNQMGARPGACVATFPWWHTDVFDLIDLKDEGGKESSRARNLQYSIKLNRLFLKRIKDNQDITLFDPKEVPLLLTTYGEAFDKAYTDYERSGKGRRVPAQELAYKIAQIRAETGNLYVFFSENANEQSPFNDMITQSNLCQEVFLPTIAAGEPTSELVYNYSTQEFTTITKEAPGLLALCNLSSINVAAWMDLSPSQRYQVAYNLLRASDNLIDWQYYPIKDGEYFNRNYRAIGIGQNNLAYHFARLGIKYSSQEALTEMERICESIYSTFQRANQQLAAERGNFPFYNRCKLTKPSRFATMFSIAPTASSSLIIGATEGIEPILELITEKTGTYSSKQLAPELAKYGANYELAYDIPTKALYDLAAVRQRVLLDQGQSINTYMRNTTSAYEIISDIIYAESVGLKSLYYLQSKNTSVETCDSCAS